MHNFSHRPKATQQVTCPKTTIHAQSYFGHSPEANSNFQSQRTNGNQAVQQSLQSNAEERNTILTGTTSPHFRHGFCRIPIHVPAAATIQTKLAINTPRDKYEQEADRAADLVMRMPEPKLQRACACGGTCPKCNAEQLSQAHERLQAKRAQKQQTTQTRPATVRDVISSPGHPLESTTREFMESRFGHDFSRVRVHDDIKAAESARAVNALAYTVGHDLVFGSGQFSPRSESGRRLLAHELTHVVQQSGRVQLKVQRQAFECSELLASPTIASLVGGSAVHSAIAAHFAETVADARQVMIPGASAGPLRTGGICGDDAMIITPQRIGGAAGAGFPDLARITPGGILQVAEIKPAAIPCLVDGEEQMLRYIDQGNAADPAQMAWRASQGVTVVAPMLTSAYSPPSFSLGVAQVETAWCSPGLLAYTVRASDAPVTVPVPVRSDERSQERQRYRDSGRDRIPVTVAVGVGALATAVVGRALWRHFWRAVTERFALRGAVALGLAAADGPLPFGEIIDIGIGVATAIEIFVVWDDLWRDADRIAAAEGA